MFALALVAALYLFDLARTPVYFGGDEAHFAVGAHAIATTGRNLKGDRLPLFVNLADPLGGKSQVWGDTYYQPFLFYLNALVIKVVPLSIAAIRVPAAVIGGVLSPLLLFVVARRLIGHALPALVAALVLALAPTHVILSRQALDYIAPIPFVLGWLWLVDAFMRTRRNMYATLAGLVLGIGCYSYIASWGVMPMLLLLTWLVLWRAGAGTRPIVLSALAFAAPVSLAPIWIAFHPEMIRETVARYGTTEQPRVGALRTYLTLIDPTVWFVRGGPSLTTSTARSGFVLLPVALLLAAGLVALLRRRDWIAAVIAIGLIVSPIPAALKGEPGMIQRALYVLPFAALLAGYGVVWLWQSRIGRAIAVMVLLASPIQFAYFYFDYFTHYKFRSAFYYDPAAFQGVADYLFAANEAPEYYFTTNVDDASVKWRFYTLLAGRTALLPRTRYIEPDIRHEAAPGSLLVTYDDTARLAALAADGWRLETVVHDADNRPAAAILRKGG